MEKGNKVTKVAKMLKGMSREDLLALNKVVVGQINSMQRLENAQAAMNFSVGDKVSFLGRMGSRVYAVVEKVNRTTVTIRAAGGIRWKVSPRHLYNMEYKGE